jgi:MYXO-CTERM domain-containing protein
VLNDSGSVAGFSTRVSGVNTQVGSDSWVWNGTTTQQIGLTGGVYTGSAGYRASGPSRMNAIGHVVGNSSRVTGVNTSNGTDTWVWNGSITKAINPTGGVYTGSVGRQESDSSLINSIGDVVGVARRFAGLSTYIGEDVWYYDSDTDITTAIVGSIRTSDNYAYSRASVLTDGGFLLGYYSFFAGGVDPSQYRAFIFRPDLGLTDLGELVHGGLGASGWDTLSLPQFSSALNYIVGSGLPTGQASGQSVFLMVPAPGAAGLFALGGLLAARRRRPAAR